MTLIALAGPDKSQTSTVDSFTGNLPELLGSMMLDPRTFVVIAEFSDGRYVQFWVEPDSTVVGEVVSNLNCTDGAIALTDEDERRLRDMGWSEPSPGGGGSPNWQFEASGVGQLGGLVAMTCRAVYDVLGERPWNEVTVRTWEVERLAAQRRDDVRESCRHYFQVFIKEVDNGDAVDQCFKDE